MIHNHILQANVFHAWFQLQYSIFGELVLQTSFGFPRGQKNNTTTHKKKNKLVSKCYNLTMCFVLTEKISWVILENKLKSNEFLSD